MITLAHSDVSVEFLSWINEQLRAEVQRRTVAPSRPQWLTLRGQIWHSGVLLFSGVSWMLGWGR